MSAAPPDHVARALLAEALEVPSALVGAETALNTTSAWKSLAHMRLVLAIETHRGRPLSPEEIVSIESYADVCRLIL